MEEELIARTKALNEHRFSISPQPTSVGNILLDYLEFDEEKMDTERLQQQSQEEYDARVQMSREETQQCQDGDSFWGIQAEEIRQHTSNIAMAQEEAASRRFADDAFKQALSVTWEAEVLQNAAKELAARGGQEQRMRERYFQWFYHHCVSVDELLEYRWPTKQQQECLENSPSPGKRRHQAIQLHSDAMASATPYPLDDLIVRERLEHGDLRYGLRSILTVHHQNSRGTNGTHFEITMASPECAFDEVVTAALLKSQTLVYPSDQSMNSDEGSLNGFERQEDRIGNGSQNGELTSGSSINYHRSRTPDPHIPARFNGVPYKPNQVSSDYCAFKFEVY
ncbi:Hypothetical protein PHPALM_17464 [Phytophthora palmivora]|uniref:Uncharacterized protein n=1 Tax=Phytophthora palmivora TaxID=4796 RepID=A0A2P4XM51_9STRA|nr:Hypothetical protein PHPALM_17464 [Phytophthora palmivora]